MAKTYYIVSESQYKYLLDNNKPTVVKQDTEEVGSNYISLLPPRIQTKGKTLSKLLLENPRFRIGTDGSIIYRGKRAEGSHIVDLLNLSLSTGYKKHCAVKGLLDFASAIKDSNVPRYLLSTSFINLVNSCK